MSIRASKKIVAFEKFIDSIMLRIEKGTDLRNKRENTKNETI